MRRAAALTVLTLALVGAMGCGSNLKGKIEGTKWVSLSFKTKDGEVARAGASRLLFNADGSMAWIANGEKYKGVYTFGSDDYVTFKFNRDVAGQRTHDEKITVNGDRLLMIDSNGFAIPFERMTQ